MSISYLNGEWQAVEEAKISVLDRGFLFGDGVYEVIPVYKKKPFTLDLHLKRLNDSLKEIKLSNPRTTQEWTDLIMEGIERSGEQNAALYLQITRGADTKRNFVYPEKVVHTVFMMVSAASILERKVIKPYHFITLEDFRWNKGHIKSISLIAAGMIKNEAITQGADDAVLIKNGKVTECSAANIFIVLNGALITPPKSKYLLQGITRDQIIKVAISGGIKVEEREITPEELKQADEMFMTRSTHEAWPVGSLDGKPIGNGEAGVVWQEVDRLFQALKSEADS
ncbi:MAG: aminotransferase class IV [Pseudomonadales bacterium]|nr:aminotransferase class IV [Pseudomonadales bacterium]